MASDDNGRFTVLVVLTACLLVLCAAYDTVLGPSVSGVAETVRRRQHYERTVAEKGLPLHRGMYWKETE